MRKIHLASILVALLFLAAHAGVAHAQATRTWVSGVGDDVNPCSRTAPCKTFAGAISKTAAGGEINIIDAGAYGTVTITKSITIDGRTAHAGVLSSATNGIVINAASTDRVTLRNLEINGGTPSALGLNGIRFLAGNALQIENVRVFNYGQKCVEFEPATKANLLIIDSTFTNCGTTAISVAAASGGNSLAKIERSAIYKSGIGVVGKANSVISISNSTIANNGGGGVQATISTSTIDLDLSSVVNNTNFGIQSDASATIRLARTSVTGNVGTGLLATNGGQILSFNNNFVAGNSPDGSRTGTLAPQ